MRTHPRYSMNAEVRGQLVGVRSRLPPGGFWGAQAGHGVCQEVPFPVLKSEIVFMEDPLSGSPVAW